MYLNIIYIIILDAHWSIDLDSEDEDGGQTELRFRKIITLSLNSFNFSLPRSALPIHPGSGNSDSYLKTRYT